MIAEIDIQNRAPLVIGATGMDAILQNIRIIIMTFCGSIPLDRVFAHKARPLDSPAPLATARLTGEIIKVVEKYEPRVKVQKLDWVYHDKKSQLEQGALTPRLTFSLKKGVEL